MTSFTNHTDDHDEEHGHIDSPQSLVLLVVALFFGVLCQTVLKRTPVPYTVLLLLIGMLFGYFDYQYSRTGDYPGGYNDSALHVSIRQWSKINPHLVLYAFLPVLIFESAFNCNWHIFRRELGQILLLAVPGVVVCTVLTATFIRYLPFGISNWNACLMIGAMLSATDPVAVVALMKELGTSERLSTLIEGESLLNDGTSIVIFNVFLDAVTGESRSPGETALYFLQLSVGGTCIGLVMGFVATQILGRIFNDATSEIAVTLLAAYGTFIIAEGLHTSGVLALVALGLVISAAGILRVEPTVQHVMHEFWELAGYFANTVIFFVSGIIVVERGILGTDLRTNGSMWGLLLLIYVLLHVARFAMLAMFHVPLSKMGFGLTYQQSGALGYGGLRGAVGLSLALVIYEELDDDEENIREVSIFLMCGIAFLTLAVNGTTMGNVLSWLGLSAVSAESEIAFEAKSQTLEDEVLEELDDKIKSHRFLSGVNMGDVLRYLPIHSYESYLLREELIEKYQGSDHIPPRIQGRWQRYKEKYRQMGLADLAGSGGETHNVNGMEMGGSNVVTNELHQSSSMDSSKLQDINDITLLADLRKRFARALKTEYWHLIDAGFLDGTKGGMLLEVADTMLNDEDGLSLPIRTFELLHTMLDSRVIHILTSGTFGWLLNIPGFRNMLKQYTHAELAALFEISSNFAAAHEAALHSVTGSRDGEMAVYDTVLSKEVMLNLVSMDQYAAEYYIRFPEIIEAVKVQLAARVMLATERNKIDHLKHVGVLDDREIGILLQSNSSSSTKLPFHPISAAVPSKRRTLRTVPFLRGLSDQAIQEVAHAGKERLFKPGDVIMKKGDKSTEWLLIIRGSARVVIREAMADQGNSIASILSERPLCTLAALDEAGLVGVLTGDVRRADVMANGFVQAYSWDVHATKQIFSKYPLVEHELWKKVAFFLCCNMVSDFHGLPEEEVEDFVEDAEVWKASSVHEEPASQEEKTNGSKDGAGIHMSPKASRKGSGDVANVTSDVAFHSLLLAGSVKAVDSDEEMDGVRIIEPGTYSCSFNTVLFMLPAFDPLDVAARVQHHETMRITAAGANAFALASHVSLRGARSTTRSSRSRGATTVSRPKSTRDRGMTTARRAERGSQRTARGSSSLPGAGYLGRSASFKFPSSSS